MRFLLLALLVSLLPFSLTARQPGKVWKTTGFQQANSMGGGEAAIPENGKFRVFLLMGQSNMAGAGRARELTPPYSEKHQRIRIWANGRWEYFVPSIRFGPGVSMAHELAEFWPNDTIGIIKVASGGTGIRGFEKNWSFERASLTFDGRKGSLYRDVMNAIEEAGKISDPEISGIVWKQGAADGRKKELANAYFDTFQQLVGDLRSDLRAPELPVFVLSYLSDEELLKMFSSFLREDELKKLRSLQEDPAANDSKLLDAILSHLDDTNSPSARKAAGRRRYIGTVIAAQNRAGREIPGVVTICHGKLPTTADGLHFNTQGQLQLGKITAAAIREFYQGDMNVTPRAQETETETDQ